MAQSDATLGDALANVNHDKTYVRVQVLTNAGALDWAKQLAVARQLTDLVVAAAGDPSLAERTWVLLTEAPDGGSATTITRAGTLLTHASVPHCQRARHYSCC